MFFFFYSQGHEPFVSFEGLEQLHRFLFILGITHVLYSFVTVVLSMIKVSVPSSLLIEHSFYFLREFYCTLSFCYLVQIYSWRKWETLAGPIAAEEMKGSRSNVTSTAMNQFFVRSDLMQQC
jgi:mlo protein